MTARAVLAAAAMAGVVNAARSIVNSQAWTTDDGSQLPLQDGNVLHGPDGAWYFVGMSYGLCKEQQPRGCTNVSAGNCGFRLDHRVLAYRNDELAQTGWSFAADLLPADTRPLGIYFRPKIAWHPVRREFVLWVRWLDPEGLQGNDHFLVASGASLLGGLAVRDRDAQLLHFNGADFDFFATGADAYIVYTARSTDTTLTVEALTPDWLGSAALGNSSATSGLIGGGHVEAPVMFERRGWFYVLSGHLCCFCAEGAGVRVLAAAAPLGPYVSLGNPGLLPNGTSVTGAQEDFALTLRTYPNGTARGEPLVLWQGNRWQSAPDGLKDHDLQYWLPLRFGDGSPAPVLQLARQDVVPLE